MARTGRAFPSQPSTGTHAAHAQVTQRLAAPSVTFLTGAGQFIQRSLNPANYIGTVNCYLEVHMFSGTGTAMTARLRNVTIGVPIGLSSVSTTSTTLVRVRSGPFSLDTGDNIYEVDIGGNAGGTYTILDAVVIVTMT